MLDNSITQELICDDEPFSEYPSYDLRPCVDEAGEFIGPVVETNFADNVGGGEDEDNDSLDEYVITTMG